MKNQRKMHALIGVLAVTIISVSAVLIPYLISLRDQVGENVVPTAPDESDAAGVVPPSGWDACNGWDVDTANWSPDACRQEATDNMPKTILNNNPIPAINDSAADWRAWSFLPEVDKYLSLGTQCGLAPSYCLPKSCGQSECNLMDSEAFDDCEDGYICVAANDGNNYCANEEYQQACSDDPSVANCCNAPEPSPTPTPIACGLTGCVVSDNPDETGCATGYTCVAATGGATYCALEELSDACTTDPGESSCCTMPSASPSPTPTPTRTVTPEPSTTPSPSPTPTVCQIVIQPKTPSPTPTLTPTLTPTNAATPTPTNTPAPNEPRIDIEKSTNGIDADEGPGPNLVVGDSLTWRYVVTNTGDVALKNIVVTDDREGTISCPRTDLEPDEKMTCAKDGTVGTGQYANSATVNGEDDGGRKVSDTDPSHYHAGEVNTPTPTPTDKPGTTPAPSHTPAPNEPTNTPTPTIYLPQAGNSSPTLIVGGIGILVGILALALLM